jgi:hypothetical protein
MTRLRPKTARAVAEYPSSPVVYRRPVLRAFFALFYGGTAAGLVWQLAVPSDNAADQLSPQDWWLGLVFFLLFGGAYLYASSRLVLDATHVRLYNPFRRADIPLAHVAEVVPGSNLLIVTDYARFYAWGVEAANAQLAADSFGTQGDVASLIRRAAQTAGNATDPPARYHFSMPDPLFFVVGVMYLAITMYVTFAL